MTLDPHRCPDDLANALVSPDWIYDPNSVVAWQRWDARRTDIAYAWIPGGLALLMMTQVGMAVLGNKFGSDVLTVGAVLLSVLGSMGIIAVIRAWKHNERPHEDTLVNIAFRTGEMVGMQQVRQARAAAAQAYFTVGRLDEAARDYLQPAIVELDRAVFQMYQIARQSENAATVADLCQRAGDIDEIVAQMRELSDGSNIAAMAAILQHIDAAQLSTTALWRGRQEIGLYA